MANSGLDLHDHVVKVCYSSSTFNQGNKATVGLDFMTTSISSDRLNRVAGCIHSGLQIPVLSDAKAKHEQKIRRSVAMVTLYDMFN